MSEVRPYTRRLLGEGCPNRPRGHERFHYAPARLRPEQTSAAAFHRGQTGAQHPARLAARRLVGGVAQGRDSRCESASNRRMSDTWQRLALEYTLSIGLVAGEFMRTVLQPRPVLQRELLRGWGVGEVRRHPD
jgi:hypothetical protein